MKHSLNVHVRYAHESTQVKCEYCAEAFKKQSNLNSHMKYVHDIFCNKILLDDECEIIFFECDYCTYRSCYEKNLRRHIITKHEDGQTFSCTQCEFETKWMANLQSHMKKIHLKDGEENFKCPDCDFSSSYKRNLTRHSHKMHGIK